MNFILLLCILISRVSDASHRRAFLIYKLTVFLWSIVGKTVIASQNILEVLLPKSF